MANQNKVTCMYLDTRQDNVELNLQNTIFIFLQNSLFSMGDVHMYVKKKKKQKSNDLRDHYQEQQQEESQTYLNVSLQREGRRKGRTDPELVRVLLPMGLPKCTQWDSIPSALKHMSQQVRERALYLVLMYGFQAIRNPQNCLQNVKCTCTFLGKGTQLSPKSLTFPQ